MARSILSTPAEKDCVDKVKSFIKANRDAMEKDSQGRDEKANREIDAEDMARAMVRAAELVWLAHYEKDLPKLFEYWTANSAAVKGMVDKEVGAQFVTLNTPAAFLAPIPTIPPAPSVGLTALGVTSVSMQSAGDAIVLKAKIPVIIPTP